MEGFDLYISYSERDFELVKYLEKLFASFGINTFVAQNNMPSGEWERNNPRIIKKSKTFLLILSNSSNSSPEVFKEVITAKNAIDEDIWNLKDCGLIIFSYENIINSEGLYSIIKKFHVIEAYQENLGTLNGLLKLIEDIFFTLDIDYNTKRIVGSTIFQETQGVVEIFCNSESIFQEALDAFHKGDWEKATLNFSAIEKRIPKSYSYLGFLNYCWFLSIKRSEVEALKFFKKAISIGDYKGYFGIAAIYLEKKNEKLADKYFKEYYLQAEKSDELFDLFLIGFIYEIGCDNNRGEGSHKKALEKWKASYDLGFHYSKNLI